MYRRAMDVGAAARAWVDAWSAGWAAHDPDVIAARYADECEFRSHPFREPLSGREGARRYAEEAFAEERSAISSFAEPIVAADGRAAVEYRARITTIDGKTATLFRRNRPPLRTGRPRARTPRLLGDDRTVLIGSDAEKGGRTRPLT